MRPIIAEAIGTFALVFIGTGACVVNDVTGGAIGHVGISLAFGLVVMAVISALGDVSGAHINPAVTIAFSAAGSFPRRQVPGFVVAQVAGAIAASVALRMMFPASTTLGETLPAGGVAQSFTLELLLTFLLMLVILNVADPRRPSSDLPPVAIGGTVALAALMGGPISGASMNPARSLGPAVAAGLTTHQWIYLVAPVLGAILAIPVWRKIRS